MFDNVGEKIKGVAVVWLIIGILASIVIGFASIESGGLLFLAVGVLASWVTALFLYGFGELIESTAENKRINRRILAALTGEALEDVKKDLQQESALEEGVHNEALPQRQCPHCGLTHDFDYPKCPGCGHRYKYNSK